MISIRQLENELWETADLLRSGSKLTSNEYCMPVLGLIFLRYAYNRFKLVEADIEKNRTVRAGRARQVEASDFIAKSALYLPREAQYEFLVNLPENVASVGLKSISGKPITSLGEAVNNAMILIEAQSETLRGVLPKEYTIFNDALLAEMLRIFNNSALKDVEGDVIGRIYEYFLNKFSKTVAQDDGVFFTPKSLVKMIVNVLEPKRGKLVDPACGSGGMFVQTGDFINNHGYIANQTMTFYGQEKVEYNAKLCLMNMAVHGLDGKNIKAGDDANTFYNDAHNLNGCCDYVMANPPFNVDKVNAENCQNAGRLPLGLPSINSAKEFSNGNYLWINYFYSYLNETGRAGFVMAASATDSQRNDKLIREKLVKTGHVDVMLSVGNNFFYTKSLPCSLWFFDKAKKEEIQDKILFIDARNYYTVVDRTLNEWNEWQLKNLNAIVWLYRGETEKYAALIVDYREKLQDYAQNDAGLSQIIRPRAFAETATKLKDYKELETKRAKVEIENAKRNEKKKKQKQWDERLELIDKIITMTDAAVWLEEKFGTGEYKDIQGLCKIATIAEVEEKNWSLTPGAYVGVAPVEDDGIDFAVRMKQIHTELLELQKQSNELMQTISDNMKERGV